MSILYYFHTQAHSILIDREQEYQVPSTTNVRQ